MPRRTRPIHRYLNDRPTIHRRSDREQRTPSDRVTRPGTDGRIRRVSLPVLSNYFRKVDRRGIAVQAAESINRERLNKGKPTSGTRLNGASCTFGASNVGRLSSARTPSKTKRNDVERLENPTAVTSVDSEQTPRNRERSLRFGQPVLNNPRSFSNQLTRNRKRREIKRISGITSSEENKRIQDHEKMVSLATAERRYP